MQIREFDPARGQAFQGDVSIIPIPSDIAVSTAQEISPVEGRLILQEGEVSGHHHAIALNQRHFQAQPQLAGDPLLTTSSPRLRKAFGGMAKARDKAKENVTGSAHLYHDDRAVSEMVRRGILTRSDLAIGCLVVAGAPMALTHEEHDGIALPPGQYLIGRQVESAGAEERIVAD